MTTLRIIIQFFKTWFLPLPPHDFEQPRSAPQVDPDKLPPEATPSPSNQSDEPWESHGSDEDDLPPTGDVDFSHLVKPPDGSDNRVTRTRTSPAAHETPAADTNLEDSSAEP